MEIQDWDSKRAGELTDLYNRLIIDVPYRTQIQPDELQKNVNLEDTSLTQQKILVAVDGSGPIGFAHIALHSAPDEDPVGLVRCLEFDRTMPKVGRALADRYESHFREQAVSSVEVFNRRYYGTCYPAVIDGWDHITDLLREREYKILPHDLFTHLPNYETSEPDLPLPALETPSEPFSGPPPFPHNPSHPTERPGREINLRREGKWVGGIKCCPLPAYVGGHLFDDVWYVYGVGVKEVERGKGLGRYLFQVAHHAMRNLGYRTATLNVSSENQIAQVLYLSLRFETLYRGYKVS